MGSLNLASWSSIKHELKECIALHNNEQDPQASRRGSFGSSKLMQVLFNESNSEGALAAMQYSVLALRSQVRLQLRRVQT